MEYQEGRLGQKVEIVGACHMFGTIVGLGSIAVPDGARSSLGMGAGYESGGKTQDGTWPVFLIWLEKWGKVPGHKGHIDVDIAIKVLSVLPRNCNLME